MTTVIDGALREQLLERRQRLEATGPSDAAQVARLLREVDAALARMEVGTYGLCEVCHDPIEADRLIADPLCRFCLGDLTPAQRRALEQDLQLAMHIQAGLLPPRDFRFDGWQISYHYEAAGPVSGDYCDLVPADDGSLYFMLGDVSGKGIAASLLMSQLHAMFRTLIPVGLPLNQLVERASRVFCASTLPTHYATLVCGRATPAGEVEICNAGHLPPLLLSGGAVARIDATGLPVGVFCNEQFTSSRLRLSAGDTLLLYTDGLSEAQDRSGAEYGAGRFAELICKSHALAPDLLINSCVEDVRGYRAGAPVADDLTLLALRRAD